MGKVDRGSIRFTPDGFEFDGYSLVDGSTARQHFKVDVKKLESTLSMAMPTILSQEEVARLIDSALTPFHQTVLMTLYAMPTFVRKALKIRLSEGIED